MFLGLIALALVVSCTSEPMSMRGLVNTIPASELSLRNYGNGVIYYDCDRESFDLPLFINNHPELEFVDYSGAHKVALFREKVKGSSSNQREYSIDEFVDLEGRVRIIPTIYDHGDQGIYFHHKGEEFAKALASFLENNPNLEFLCFSETSCNYVFFREK